MTEDKAAQVKDLNAQHDALCGRFYGTYVFDGDLRHLVEAPDPTLILEDFVRQHLELHEQLRKLSQ